MNTKIPQEQLKAQLREHGKFLVEARQLTQRYKSLLKNDFDSLTEEQANKASKKGKLRLEKYAEDKFTISIDKYISILSQYLTAKIQYETHFMLLKARQSLRKR